MPFSAGKIRSEQSTRWAAVTTEIGRSRSRRASFLTVGKVTGKIQANRLSTSCLVVERAELALCFFVVLNLSVVCA